MPVSNDLGDNKPERSLLYLVKQLVLKRDYNSLKTLFLKHLARTEIVKYLPDLWECISYLTKPTIKLMIQAKELSELIFEHLIQYNYDNEALDHLRRVSNLMNPSRILRQKIVILYNNVYSNNKNLDILIRISEINESAPLPQTITTLDKLLALDIGNPVYSSRFGYGEVTKIDFLIDTMTVNFFNSQNQTITLKQALTSLQPIPKDNVFYLREKKSPVLTKMVKENPAELEILLKRDLPENYKTADVKKILKGIVLDQDIETFIEYLKKNKPKIKRQVSCDLITIDYSTLPSLSIEQIIELINSAASITRQKLVRTIKEKRQDWQEIYLQIFFIQTDKRVLQIVFTESDQKHQNYLVDKAFVEYKRYPVQFLFFAEISNQDPYAIITRYLDLAQVANLKFEKTSLASEIHKRLISNNYALVRRSVTEITSDIAKRILVRIGEIKNLYPEERDIITNIIKLEFPELFETKDEYIYNTKTAINNKELELNKILNEAIPQVASEIGRARSYGDLRENFEFKAALAKQKRLISKVSEIRQELSKARPIDFSKIVTDKVNIGTSVKLLPIIEDTSPIIYTILGPWDSDLQKGIISYLAPFAQNLLNKQVGEEITDDEGKKYKITEISKEVSNEISNS